MKFSGRSFCSQRSTVCKILSCLLLISVIITMMKNAIYLHAEQEKVPCPNLGINEAQEQEVSDTVFENIKMKCIIGSKREDSEEKDVLKPLYSTTNEVLEVAKAIGRKKKTVLVSVINDGYIPFLFSWLCNTKYMNIHDSVLVITTDIDTVKILRRDWPNVNAVAINLSVPSGNQKYSRVGYVKIMVKRAELLLEILQSGVNFMLTEFDYVWFENALPAIENVEGVDILKNPVSHTNSKIFNGGLIYTFATERSVKLWDKLVSMMKEMWIQIENMPDDKTLPESENDQIFFSKLIRERYADIQTGDLPLDRYADGAWYTMPELERNKTHPVMISNNWIEGNANKMRRAKKWMHWFLLSDCTCDINLVRSTVVT